MPRRDRFGMTGGAVREKANKNKKNLAWLFSMVICFIGLLGCKHIWWLAQCLAYGSALYMFVIVFNKYGQLKTKVNDVNKI